MGVVYHGVDNIGRKVAIKTIRPGLLHGRAGRELLNRFRREAEAEARLNHPNIVGIYEFDDSNGTPFFAMEFVEGKSLKEFLSRGMHFNLDMSLHIMSQLLSALSHSHSKGIIHRDIKPANILLVEDDSVKIADFGIARMEESEFTQTGQIIGTPQYFSPEQRLGARTDARSDLYSTALVFFELLTGEKLFALYPELATNQRLGDEHLGKLGVYPPDVQRLLNSVLIKALAREPGKRFQNARDFSDALKPLMLEPEKPVKRGGKWLMAAVACIGIGVLGAAFYASQQDIDWQDVLESIIGEAPAPAPVALSPEDQAKLDRLLKVGTIHLRVGRLILPEGSNAYHAFEMAMRLDPNNAEARAAVSELQQALMLKLRKLVSDGDIAGAREQLNVAIQVFPDNPDLRSLQQEIDG